MFEKKSELIDRLQQARQELDACVAGWRNIMANSPHGILIVDTGGTIRFANPAATAIFGCRTEELLGEHFEIPAVSDKPGELSLKSRDGRTVAVEIWRMETEWQGEPAWFVALHDMTERKRGEQEMRKLYRAIMESPSIVMITDARGTIEYVNPKFTEVTGYSSAEAVGQNPRFLKSDKVPPATYQELWETISRGKEWRGEMLNRKKNGELYCEFAAISPIKDIAGAITNFVAVTEDITERKRAEEALTESRNRAQTIIASALDAVVEIEENGTILAWNPKAEEIFGWTAAEAIGRRPSETIIPTQYREAHEKGLKHFRATGEGPILNKRIELTALHRDGREFPIELTVTPIRTGSGWNFTAFLRDITERKQAEEKFRGLLESAPDAMVIVDGKGEICIINSQTEKLFGFERGELYGQKVEMLMPERFHDRHAGHKADYFLKPRVRQLGSVEELYGLHKDGHEFPVDISLSPLSTEEGVLVIAAVRDITERKQAEEALRESEERFRATFDQAAVGIAHLDPDGRLLRINRKYCEIVGYTEEELQELTFRDITHPDDLAVSVDQFRLLRAGKLGNFSLEKRYISKDGSPVWVNLTASMVYGPDGKPSYTVSIIEDIAKRKAAEESLRFSEARYRALYRDNPVMIVTLDAELTMLSVNPICASQLGYAIDELEGRPVLKLFYEADRPAVAEQLRMCLQNPDRVSRWQFRKVRKDGSLLWVEEVAQAVNGLNGALNVLVVCQDVTERKEAEEALRESEERFRTIFNQAAVGIGEVDPAGRWLRVNRKYCDIVGYTEEELKALSIKEITHPHDLETSMKYFQLVLDGKLGNYSLEKRYIRKDGSPVWVNLTVSAVADPGGNLKFAVGVVEDISDRKRAEEEIEKLNTDLAARAAELESANLELEAFNYSVAHDLRKPLTVINGYCQAIMEMCGAKLDEQCTAYLREIYDGTLRMNLLIDALLDFSRLARCEIKPETSDLSTMARDICVELRLTEPKRRVTFSIAEEVTADGDPALLRVVLENLLGNAWKYTGRLQESVIEFGLTEVDGMPACFVRDNGPGFDMAYAEKMFAPFQRLPGTDKFRGHGIGLATVERIIRRHGGRVWAEGEPGKGATFWFTLP